MGLSVARPSRPLRRTYDQFVARPGWTVCVAVILLSTIAAVSGFTAGPVVRYAPLAASAVLFGLPHGAADNLVPARFGEQSLAMSCAIVGVLYLVLGTGYAALWLVAPWPAAVAFVVMTWLHWGQGDVHALVAFVEADHLRSRPPRVATLLVRGGLPMLVPLLAFPDRYRAVLTAWVDLFGGDLTAAWLFGPETRLLAGAGFLAFTVLTLAAGYRKNGASRGWRVDAGETALLWVFFLTVPPLVAIGVYFCAWHSLRHVLRVAAGDGDGQRTPVTLLGGFARDAAPLTVVALVLLAAFVVLVPVSPTTPAETTAAYLVFIAVLTLPHVAVVTWMDYREGIWQR